MWDVLRKALFVWKDTLTPDWHSRSYAMDLPSTKLEYDAFDWLIVLTVHDSSDIMCVCPQKGFFGRKYVVIVDPGGYLVENAEAFLIVQQNLREDLLAGRSRETLDDFVTDVDLTVGGLIVEADVNDV